MNQLSRRFLSITLLAIIIGTLLLSQPLAKTQAQVPAFDLVITPEIAYWHVKPGEKLQHRINITNTGNFTIELSPQLVGFEGDGVSGQAIIKPEADFSYLQFSDPQYGWGKSFSIKPGETKELLFSIKVPFGAKEKEYHLTVLFQGVQALESSLESTNAQVAGAIGSNLVVLVSSKADNQGKLKIKRVWYPKIVDSFKPVIIKVLAENNGINSTPIAGNVSFSNNTGSNVKEYIFYPDMVLSESTRLARGVRKESLESDKNLIENQDAEFLNQLSSELEFKDPFLFGFYSVTVNLGDETRVIELFAFPFSIVVGLLIIPIVLIIYSFLKKRLIKQ